MNDAPVLPIVLAHIHVDCQRVPSYFSRHSNETTRMIRKTRMSRNAR